MALTFDNTEVRRLRAIPEYLTDRIIYTRSYDIAPGLVASLLPVVGAAVTLDGVTGTTGANIMLQPRVAQISRVKQPKGGLAETGGAAELFRVTFYQLRPNGASTDATTYTELKGSRRAPWEAGLRLYGERLFASTAGACGISRADAYPGDTDNACKRVALTPTSHLDVPLPGLYYHRIIYVGFISYDGTGTTVMEIKGSRRVWGGVQHNYAERIFVSTTGSSGITEGTAYPGDTAATISARLAQVEQTTPEPTPGRFLSRVPYVGFRTE
jgi:hypothetical protein